MRLLAVILLVAFSTLARAQLDPNIFYQRQIAVSGTNFVNEQVTSNGISLKGVRNISWPIFQFPQNKSLIMFEGDSLTAPSNPSAYASIMGSINPAWNLIAQTNFAVAGNGLVNLSNRWTASVAPLVASSSSSNIILSVWVGANDYFQIAPATYYTQLSNYWNTAKSSNCTVVAFTIMPRNSFNGLSDSAVSNLLAINEYIRHATNWDYLVDVAAMFPNCMDQTYFNSDFTHLNNYAQFLLAQEFDAVLRAPPRKIKPRSTTQIGTNTYSLNSSGSIFRTDYPDANLAQVRGSIETWTNLYIFAPAFPLGFAQRFAITVATNGTVSSSRNETNQPVNIGVAPDFWYLAGNIATNSSVFYIYDWWTGHYDLTNSDVSTHWATPGAGINGYPTLANTNSSASSAVFNGQNGVYSNAGGVQEIWMVMSNIFAAANGKYILDGGTNTGRRYVTSSTGITNFVMGQGSSFATTNGVPQTVGTWAVYTFVWNGTGTNSYILTNNVMFNAGSVGAPAAISGLSVGAAFNRSGNAQGLEWAEIVGYNQVLSSANRALLYTYFKNKYASTNTGIFAWP